MFRNYFHSAPSSTESTHYTSCTSGKFFDVTSSGCASRFPPPSDAAPAVPAPVVAVCIVFSENFEIVPPYFAEDDVAAVPGTFDSNSTEDAADFGVFDDLPVAVEAAEVAPSFTAAGAIQLRHRRTIMVAK